MNDSRQRGTGPEASGIYREINALAEMLEAQADVEQEQARQAEFANSALEAQFHLGVRSGIRRAAGLLRRIPSTPIRHNG